MQQKFTLKNIGVFSRFLPVFCALFFLVTAKAQQYVNGGLSTGATSQSGIAAPAGTTWSEVQNYIGVPTQSNTNAGSAGNAGAFTLADNFTIPAGGSWNINKLSFYAYQTGSAPTPSPFTALFVQIHNANPALGATTIVFGDLTTNRLTASVDPLMYRVFNTVAPAPGTAPGTTRKIWKLEANIAVTLAPGTYWIEWATVVAGNPATAHFAPTKTISGTRGVAGDNAIQKTVSSGAWAAVIDGGNPVAAADVAQDFPFIVDYTGGTACTGTPAPGATNASVSTICPGLPFNLSLASATTGAGVSYQWQSGSSATGPWTNINSAVNSTLSISLNATTFYRCNVTCGANTGSSTPVGVTLSTSCYCAAGGASAVDEKIGNVTFGSINNTTTLTTPYSDYTALSTNVVAGQVVPFSASISTAFSSDQILVWIDFNKDGDFSDPGEQVYVSGQGVGPHTGNITISPSALLGTTRMRVRLHDAVFGPLNNPCGTAAFGEVEDYTINVQPCVQGVFTSVPVNATIQCSQNATFTVAATGSALSYSWQYRVSAAGPWLTIPNAAPYSGATTPTLTLTNVSQSFSGYQYRALITGPCTAVDFSSPPATLTVNALQPLINPTSATICAGSVQQLSITNIPTPTTTTFNSGAISLPVPDVIDCGGATAAQANAGINHTIPVSLPVGSVISNMKVRMTVTTTWMGDLIAVLRAPNGQIFNLLYHRNGTGGTAAGSGTLTNATISSTSTTAISSGAPPYSTPDFRT